MEVVAKNLERYLKSGIPIGISIGKNKNIADKDAPEVYAKVVRRLYPRASYFAINVSSPNTPGLRKLQDKEPLTRIVKAVNQAMFEGGGRKPLFVKIAPDLTDSAVDDVIQVVIDYGLTGIIATNTTNNPEIKAKYKRGQEMGGLSGNDPEFRRMATEKIAHIFLNAGKQIQIIGVGGVYDSTTAVAKIEAGASAIQIVTGIRGEGTILPGIINREISEYLRIGGTNNISEIVGTKAQSIISSLDRTSSRV